MCLPQKTKGNLTQQTQYCRFFGTIDTEYECGNSVNAEKNTVLSDCRLPASFYTLGRQKSKAQQPRSQHKKTRNPPNLCAEAIPAYDRNLRIAPLSARHSCPLKAGTRAVLATPPPCSWRARSVRGPAGRAPADRALSPRSPRRGAGLPLRPRPRPMPALTHKSERHTERTARRRRRSVVARVKA